MAALKFTLNGKSQTVDVPPAMPLLWVLRDTLGMTGTKFGCGMSLCGACTIHLDGQPVRSCVTPISNVAGKSVTTIEGLSADRSNPIQQAWIAEDVPQCGYCQSGQIMTAAALLAKPPTLPTQISTRPCATISVVAGPISPSGAQFIWPRNCASRQVSGERAAKCQPPRIPAGERCRSRRRADRFSTWVPGIFAGRILQAQCLRPRGHRRYRYAFHPQGGDGAGTVTCSPCSSPRNWNAIGKRSTEFAGVNREYGTMQGVFGSGDTLSFDRCAAPVPRRGKCVQAAEV